MCECCASLYICVRIIRRQLILRGFGNKFPKLHAMVTTTENRLKPRHRVQFISLCKVTAMFGGSICEYAYYRLTLLYLKITTSVSQHRR